MGVQSLAVLDLACGGGGEGEGGGYDSFGFDG